MSIRPIALLLLAGFLCASPSAYAQIPETTAYTDCINEKLEGIEIIKTGCKAAANADAAASSNAAVGSPDPGAGEGKAQDCIEQSVARLRRSAERECKARASNAMEALIDRPQGDEPTDPGDQPGGISNCVPTASRKCPAKAPLPRARPKTALNSVPAKLPAAKTPAAKSPTSKAPPSKTTRTNQAAANSARKTTPQAPSVASGDAGGDVSLCESSYSAATRCCGNPSSCVNELSYAEQRQFAQVSQMMNQPPPTTSQGLNDYCQQMQGLGSDGRGVNSSLAGICNSKQMSCSMVCSDLAQKYQTLISNCNGCESEGIYQNTYAQISSRISSCNALASRVSQITNQAISSSASSAYGNLCNNVSSSAPQSQPGGSPVPSASGNNPLGGTGNDRFAQNCTVDPTSAACRALMGAQPTGTASFGGGDTPKKGKSDFNLPSDNSLTEKSFFSNGVEPQAVKTGTVANNSGGAMPGGEGGSPAKLDAAGRPQSPGAPGYTTDIMNGTQGDGGYSAPVQDNGPGGTAQAAAMLGSRMPGSIDDNGGVLGMDLRQFLPGGSRDPQRRLAGIGRRSEINGKEEDIWRLISSKMVEKCKLGILIDCR